MENYKPRLKNQILGSEYENEINDMRTAGSDLKVISDLMWNKYAYKVSLATLTRYFQLRKQLGPIAVQEVKDHIKATRGDEYMDTVGRIAFANAVIIEAKKRFEQDKSNMLTPDLMVFAIKMMDYLAKIEGADAQGDLLRDFATLILEVKTDVVPQRLPIIEVALDGTTREVSE